jgi:KaiC/GvpD/RAD55 family RecA-like ATPase
MDSLSIQMKIANTKDKMNKRLIDSFSVAFVRDQEAERQDYSIMAKNDLKMPNFTMDFENYGYPSIQKIGLFGNNGVLCQW